MTAALPIALYAAVVAFAAPAVVGQWRWLERAPRLGVAVWLAMVWSMAAAIVLVGVTAALDSDPIRDFVVDLIRACVHVFHEQYQTTPSAAIGAGIVTLLVLGWLASQVGVNVLRNQSVRRRHSEAARILGRQDDAHGVTVVDFPAVTAYCIPGRNGRIVVTSAAVQALDPEELAAMVAHERAHLAGRHHLLVGAARIVRAAFPFLPAARQAPAAVGFYVERLADEQACLHHDRDDVASALLAAASAQAPSGTLGIGGETVARRALRLLDHAAPPRWGSRLLGLATVTLFVAAPLLLAVIPALGIAFADHCPLPPA